MNIETIRNYLSLDQRTATSGMPTPAHFATLRQAGFDVVINLAMPTSDNAMSNEGELVAAQGMTYVHIPVRFEAPRQEDFERFTRVLEACGDRRVFVHCAANMRVSAFMFLHRMRLGSVSRAEAERDLKKIWEPDGVWRQFIDARLAELGKSPLASQNG